MSQETTVNRSERSLSNAIANGLRSKCPNCGRGTLYRGFITVVDDCSACDEALHHHRADDLPTYLNIFIVGHIVVALLMVSMKYELFGVWPTAIGGSVLAIFVSLSLIRPIKGMVVAIQWALAMHGFGDDDEQ